MKEVEKYQNLVKDRWYAQSCNSTPIHIMSAGFSAFSLKQKIGYGYSQLMYEFENDFGRINYYVPDLERLSEVFLKEFEKDHEYFIKLKQRYDKEVAASQKLFSKIDALYLETISDSDLYKLITEAIHEIEVSVGIGHVIEAYVLATDESLKKELGKVILDARELNEAFILLTTPTEDSFLQKSEHALKGIAQSPNQEREAAEYIKQFFWIKNTYSSRHVLIAQEVIAEAKTLKDSQNTDVAELKQKQADLLNKLQLETSIKARLSSLLFITLWQDERKKNILIAIDYLERLLERLSSRTSVPVQLLRYAKVDEFNTKISEKAAELKLRRKGSLFFQFADRIEVVSGEQYLILKGKTGTEEIGEVKQLSGNAASVGSVIGTVKVCTTVESLNKVQEGDILVASMTRPEYLPAMKRAVAFVTDEGGITCHAAIVAREMKKPCVIGTKVATQVLRDGDEVEVKGYHGLIIIRRRAK